MTDTASERAPRRERADLERELEEHRVQLTAYCYRMLGSAFESEDAVQETLIRAWRSLDRFDGRSTLRTWLYSIATNVCIDMLNSRKRRAVPMDFGPSSKADSPLPPPLTEQPWLEPIPDGRVLPDGGDPAETVVARESVRLAFIAALQHLPPRQRAVLILRDVLRWKTSEVAALLDGTVASVNSALQRARATLQATDLDEAEPSEPSDDAHKVLLTKYVDAFERYDIESFVSLLHEDAKQAMPPYAMWIQGTNEIAAWMLGPGIPCKGSRLIPVEANGTRAFAQYKPSDVEGRLDPWAIQVLDISDGRVAGIMYFLDTNLFRLFGLPDSLAV